MFKQGCLGGICNRALVPQITSLRALEPVSRLFDMRRNYHKCQALVELITNTVAVAMLQVSQQVINVNLDSK